MQDELVMVSGMPILNGFNISTFSSPPHPFLLLLILKHFLRRHPFLCISWVLSSFYDYYWSITSSQSPLVKPSSHLCLGDQHVSEIALMALDLLAGMLLIIIIITIVIIINNNIIRILNLLGFVVFQIPHKPNARLAIR